MNREQSRSGQTSIAFPPVTRRLNSIAHFNLGVELSLRHGAVADRRRVIQLLQKHGQRCVLIGTHSVNPRGGKPRTSIDIDLVAEDPAACFSILGCSFNTLVRSETKWMFRFHNGKHDAIDIFKPTAHVMFQAALPVVLPGVEMTLALKFFAYRSRSREMAYRYQDLHDFMLVSELHPVVNEEKLLTFGNVAVARGGQRLLRDFADARAQRRIDAFDDEQIDP